MKEVVSLPLPLSLVSFHSGFSVLDHQPSWDLGLSPLTRSLKPDVWIVLQVIQPLLLSPPPPCVHVDLVSLSCSVFVSFLLYVLLVCLSFVLTCIFPGLRGREEHQYLGHWKNGILVCFFHGAASCCWLIILKT